MARLVSYGVGAVEPGMFGLGPVPAVKQALERAGWKTADIQRIEINEAFAAIAIAVAKDLGLPEDVVNIEGGAIAHGHPIGASGAVLTTRLLHSMQRDGIKRGIVTLCIGGGQGIALALENGSVISPSLSDAADDRCCRVVSSTMVYLSFPKIPSSPGLASWGRIIASFWVMLRPYRTSFAPETTVTSTRGCA